MTVMTTPMLDSGIFQTRLYDAVTYSGDSARLVGYLSLALKPKLWKLICSSSEEVAELDRVEGIKRGCIAVFR